MPEPSVRVEVAANGAASTTLRLGGRLDFRGFFGAFRPARERLLAGTGRVDVDLGAVEVADAGSIALLVQLEADLAARGRPVEFRAASGRVAQLLDLHRAAADAPRPAEPPPRFRALDALGTAALQSAAEVREFLAFFGDCTASAARAVLRPSTVHWRDLPKLLERVGADGVPIVLVINFLVGVTVAYMMSVQLDKFGAGAYVADGVALAVVRSMGPLMTAIIVAGRTGAAFAAEIGTMKVSEEIDALKTLGFDPTGFLVLPRVLAAVIALPLLTLLADAAAIAGGMLIGVTGLGLSADAYLARTRGALDLVDIGSGLFKTLFFAQAIGLLACQRGLATAGGAEGVGRATTAAVVSNIFAIVVLESLFAVLFDVWGI